MIINDESAYKFENVVITLLVVTIIMLREAVITIIRSFGEINFVNFFFFFGARHSFATFRKLFIIIPFPITCFLIKYFF